jgi:hypothetical protein
MISKTSLAKSSSKEASSPLIDDHHFNAFHFANRENQLCAKAQETVFVSDHQALNFTVKKFLQ